MELNGLSAIKPIQVGEKTNNSQGTPDSSGVSFGDFLQNAISEVNNLQKTSEAANIQLAAGENIDLHTVMIAGEKANLALQLTVQVRNKVIEAYQEVMRMQV